MEIQRSMVQYVSLQLLSTALSPCPALLSLYQPDFDNKKAPDGIESARGLCCVSTTFGGKQAQAELAIIIAAAMLMPMPCRLMVMFDSSHGQTIHEGGAYTRVVRWIKHAFGAKW